MEDAIIKVKKASVFYRLVIVLITFWFKIFYRHKVYGIEHYPKGSAIIAPNHVSFLDPPLIAISCPEEVSFLARETLFKSKLSFIIKALNTYPIKKGESNIKIMKVIYQMLKNERKVLLFPEGTRAETNELGPIRPGIGVLLLKSESAILPVYIHGTFEIWNRNRKLPKIFGKTACVFGSPILWEDYADIDRKEAQEMIAQRLVLAINELKRWYDEGAQGIPP